METRAERAKRERDEARLRNERLILNRLGKDAPPQHSPASPHSPSSHTPHESTKPHSPARVDHHTSPRAETDEDRARRERRTRLEEEKAALEARENERDRMRKERQEKQRKEEEELRKQLEERKKQREERRRQLEEEQRQHELKVAEKRREREERKLALMELEMQTTANVQNFARRESFMNLQSLASTVSPSTMLSPVPPLRGVDSHPEQSPAKAPTPLRGSQDAPSEPKVTVKVTEPPKTPPRLEELAKGDAPRRPSLTDIHQMGQKEISSFRSTLHSPTSPNPPPPIEKEHSKPDSPTSAKKKKLSKNGAALLANLQEFKFDKTFTGEGGRHGKDHKKHKGEGKEKTKDKRGGSSRGGTRQSLSPRSHNRSPSSGPSIIAAAAVKHEGEGQEAAAPAVAAPARPHHPKKHKAKKPKGHKEITARTTIAGSNPVAQMFRMGESSTMLRVLLGVGEIELSTKERIIKDLPMPRSSRLKKEELFSKDTSRINLELLREHLFEEGRLELDLAKEILGMVKELFKQESNILELNAPLAICGDIHGQFYDLMGMIDTVGDPEDMPYLFLGDYVDRGCFSTEVCFYLFACKILYPTTFHLIRGNHESRQLAEYFNFKSECKYKYNEEVYNEFMDVFDCLPLAALVKGTNVGPFFCCHGGLSPFFKTLDDIRKIDRFCEPPYQGAFCDLLWSDPLVEQYDLNASEHTKITFLQNSLRSCSYIYGWKAVTEFLEQNSIKSIVRAHEVQQNGYTEHWFKQEKAKEEGGYPYVITVFSAPNYCDMYQNKAACLLVEDNKYYYKQTSWVDHPAYLPNFQDGIAFSIPYILEQFSAFCLELLKPPDDDEESFSKPISKEDQIRQREESVRKLMILMRKLRKENDSLMEKPESKPTTIYDRNLSSFERAMKWDRKNEGRPKQERLYRTL